MPKVGRSLRIKVLILSLFLVLGHALCLIRQQEFFPFSHYPLFDRLQRNFIQETSVQLKLNGVSWEPRLRNCFRLSYPESLHAASTLKFGSSEEREKMKRWLLQRPTKKLRQFKAAGPLTLQVVNKRWNLDPQRFAKRVPDQVTPLWESLL